MNNTNPISAIVLAAGLSSRMRGDNKLHLSLSGVPLIQYSINALVGAGISEIVVVLGYQYQRTRDLIKHLPVTIVFNPDFSDGHVTSVRTGLRALTHETSGTIIALGDQPAVNADHISTLLDKFCNCDKAQIVIPYYRGQRGNPVIISANVRQSVLANRPTYSCRDFIDENSDLVTKVEMTDPSVLIDLDNKEDYQHYCNTYLS